MLSLNIAGMSNLSFIISHQSLFTFACVQIRHNPLSGGYCGGVPPLPIPNREVKPTCADGTAMQCGRVGRRLLSMKSLRFRKISEAFLFFFIGFHGWIGWQSCLSDYSRISADIWPLANGSRPKWASIVFVTQISRIYTDFSHWLFFSWIYMDFLWFSSFRCHFFFFSVISLFRRF